MLARKMMRGKVTFHFSSRVKIFSELAQVSLLAG